MLVQVCVTCYCLVDFIQLLSKFKQTSDLEISTNLLSLLIGFKVPPPPNLGKIFFTIKFKTMSNLVNLQRSIYFTCQLMSVSKHVIINDLCVKYVGATQV